MTMTIGVLVLAFAVLGTTGLMVAALVIWLVWRSTQPKPPQGPMNFQN